MGNAVWRGVRLKDILAEAGVAGGAIQVRFGGFDKPAHSEEPPFRKSLEMDVATRDDVLVAYAMNGEPLPVLNGYPVRLVVPGYYATYWVKMLNDIEVLDRPDDNYWMKTAYRVPADPCRCQQPGKKGANGSPLSAHGPLVYHKPYRRTARSSGPEILCSWHRF